MLAIDRLAIPLASALLVFGCTGKPDYLEMEPKEHVFKRPGEDLWWKVVAKKRDGSTLYKAKASWSSSDPRVAAVDEVGRVKAVGPGRATLVAKVGGVAAEANVEVVAVGRITVEPGELSLEARGPPKALAIKVFDQEGRPLFDRAPSVRCVNEEVCRTGREGVHPVDPGQTMVLVTVEGQWAEIPVRVGPGGKRP